MRTFVDTFTVPKAGSSWQEYEDAACVEPARAGTTEYTGEWLVVAVADGASEALLAGRWARELVNRFTDAGPGADLATTLTAGAGAWDHIEADYRQGREEVGEPIAWFEEDGLRRGAYATIVGARLLDGGTPDEGILDVWALGDACLFQVRENAVITAFPVDDPALFGTSPPLAPSRPLDPSRVVASIRRITTSWRPGDHLYLASDAIACWFLTEAAGGTAPWHALNSLDTQDGITDFATWVDERRSDGSMRNDDTTLLRIHLTR